MLLISPCRGCGAPVFFAVNEKTGKRMIFDEKPTDKGTWIIRDRAKQCPTARHMTSEERADRTPADLGYVSHFATCPKGPDYRKARADG